MAKKSKSADLFPPIGDPISVEPVHKDEPGDDDLANRVTALQTKIDALDAQNRLLQTQHVQLLTRHVAAPASFPTAHSGGAGASLASPTVDKTGLPDPVMDLGGYLDGYHKRLNAANETYIRALRQQENQAASAVRTQQESINALWERMLDRHPELSNAQDIIEIKAREVAAAFASQGLNPMTAMLANPDQFVDDVAAATTKRLTELGKAPGNDEDDTDDGAAVLPAGPNPLTTPTRQPKPAPGFVDQIRDVQRKSGLF